MFDLDGTLLDTNELIFQSFRHTFKTHIPAEEIPEETMISFLGPSLHDSLSRYFEGAQLEEAITCYRRHNWDHHKDFVTVYPTVEETLKYLKKEKYPLAVVTTKPRDVARLGLDMFGLSQYFDLLLAYEDVECTKPDPEGIHKSMNQLGRKSGVMTGDSIADIQAGKNAGVYTAGVEWTFKPVKMLTDLSPDLMLGKMEDLIPFVEQVEKSL